MGPFRDYGKKAPVDERIQIIEDLHGRYAGVLYDKCVRILGDAAEAEDALQETFVSAFRSLARFEDTGQGHLPWLYRVATNACLKIIRTRRRKGAQPMEDQDALPGQSPDPVEGISSRRVIEQLMNQLDERGMQIFVAHYVDGIDQGEIARQMGISRRAVVKRLTALRARAQDLVEGGAGHE